MTRKLNLLGIILMIPILLAAPQAQAEINYMDMKGVHQLIKPEYQNELSPIWGLTLLKTHTLENRRFFGNYGPKTEAHSCMEHASNIHSILVKENDCPQDATSELIQRLFPSQDGQNFVANQIPNDFISELHPEVLGKLLARIGESRGQDLKQEKFAQQLEGDLAEILFKEMNPKLYLDTQRSGAPHHNYLKKQEKNLLSCTEPEEQKRLKQNLESFKEVMVKLGMSLEPSDGDTGRSSPPGDRDSPRSDSPRVQKGSEKDFKQFAKMIVAALQEQGAFPKKYPPHLVEHALLAFFWKKGDHKEDFLKLLSGMPKMLSNSAVLKAESPEHKVFLDPKNRYRKEDYNHQAVLKEDVAQLSKRLLADPEAMAFYSLSETLEHPLPPILSYAQAKHSSLKDKEVKTYPDCGETSLRNFFNIVLYDPSTQKFDASHLESLEKSNPTLKINPSLTKFYKDHADPTLAVGQTARDQWSEEVVSNHTGVNFLKPKEAPRCEINAGIDNMMNVVDRLLFHTPGGSPSASQESLGSKSERAEKLNQLCKLLSREGFKLDWNFKGGDPKKLADKDVTIDFRINGKPSFSWTFNSGHFLVQDLTAKKDSWKKQVGEWVGKNLSQHGAKHSPLFENWFANTEVWEKRMKEPRSSDPNQEQERLRKLGDYIYSLPLASNEVKPNVFVSILNSPIVQDLKPLALRIQHRVPLNDNNAQQRIHRALADNHYPYHPPGALTLSAVGQPEVKYTRMTDPTIIEKLGKNAWKNDQHGWILGDVVRNPDGSIKEMNHKAAMEYCINLNDDPNKRDEIRRLLEEKDKIRKEIFEKEQKEQTISDELRAKLVKPIEGYTLPEKEVLDQLQKDLGYNSATGYLPQFFSNLNNEQFWSSSVHPSNVVFNAFVFNDYDGSVNLVSRGSDRSVRCLRPVAAW